MTSPEKVNDYKVLALNLPPLPSYPKAAIHYLYLRAHSSKIANPADSRTVFLVNVPFDSTTERLAYLFSEQLSAGDVEEVKFDSSGCHASSSVTADSVGARSAKSGRGQSSGTRRKRKRSVGSAVETEWPELWDRELRMPGSTALVVFREEKSVEKLLKTVKRLKGRSVEWTEGSKADREDGELDMRPLGSKRYLSHQSMTHPPSKDLEDSVNAFMEEYARAETARARLLARQRQEPDEDGFITVTRGGRVGPARQEDAQRAAEKQKAKKGELKDFYRWQLREERKAKEKELVQKFEDDTRKIGEMKRIRGRGAFRPEK